MRRAGSIFFALALSAGLGLAASAASAQGEPDFGSPPSGEYPILFNDHHVYAKPDDDKQGRVLAALVRGKTILVPLRSMFEQMGATVEYDSATKTAVVSKPGAEVRVTVGRAEVVINGESRPLDVPPEMYEGSVLVPIRVISEGMGAYVQWVASKRAVVVRYIPAPPPTPAPPPPPPPTPAPTPPPAPPPTVFATPAPVATPYYEKYIIGNVVGWPKVYNEWSNSSSPGYGINAEGAAEFPLLGIHLGLEAQWNEVRWNHTAGPVTILGSGNSTFQPTMNGVDNDASINLMMRISQPRIYFIEGYMRTWNTYGYPNLGGIGFGIEKLPDLDHATSLYGRYWYSLGVKGSYGPITIPNSTITYPGSTLSYRVNQWLIGYTWNFGGPQSPVFADIGYQGEGWINVSNAPSNRVDYGPFIGLGYRF